MISFINRLDLLTMLVVWVPYEPQADPAFPGHDAAQGYRVR